MKRPAPLKPGLDAEKRPCHTLSSGRETAGPIEALPTAPMPPPAPSRSSGRETAGPIEAATAPLSIAPKASGHPAVKRPAPLKRGQAYVASDVALKSSGRETAGPIEALCGPLVGRSRTHVIRP